ncbi:hypothetical protein D044_4315B, partial [Vibrio parahaemolyticus EKP-026]
SLGTCNTAALSYARFWWVRPLQSTCPHRHDARLKRYDKRGTKRAHELGLDVYSSAVASTLSNC